MSYFYISCPSNSGLVFELTGDAAGAKIALGERKPHAEADHQLFSFNHKANGTCSIVSKKTGLFVCVEGGSLLDGKHVVINAEGPTADWVFSASGLIVSASDEHYAMEVKGNIHAGTDIVVFRAKPTSGPNQQFTTITEHGHVQSVAQTIPFVIQSVSRPDLFLDIEGDADGSRVIMTAKKQGEEATSQLWLLSPRNNHGFAIFNMKCPDFLLGFAGDVGDRKHLVIQYDHGKPQQTWVFTLDGVIKNAKEHGFALDVDGGASNSGLGLVLMHLQSPTASHQQFRFTDIKGNDFAVPLNLPSEAVHLQPTPEFYVDSAHGKDNEKVSLVAKKGADVPSHQWILQPRGVGIFAIATKTTGLLLSVEGGHVSDGKHIVLNQDHGDPKQYWRFDLGGVVHNAGGNVVLDLDKHNVHAGVHVVAFRPKAPVPPSQTFHLTDLHEKNVFH